MKVRMMNQTILPKMKTMMIIKCLSIRQLGTKLLGCESWKMCEVSFDVERRFSKKIKGHLFYRFIFYYLFIQVET